MFFIVDAGQDIPAGFLFSITDFILAVFMDFIVRAALLIPELP